LIDRLIDTVDQLHHIIPAKYYSTVLRVQYSTVQYSTVQYRGVGPIAIIHHIMRLLVSVVLVCLCLLLVHVHVVVGQVNFVDMNNLGDLGDLLNGIKGAQNQKKDGTCPSACDDQPHLFPVPKKRIRPYSNGCSVPPSMRSGIGDYSHFHKCCDLHDTCYASCGIDKKRCESDFDKCLKRTCRTDFQSISPQKVQQCNDMADMFTMGTTMFGCGGYTELQKDTCDCLQPKEAEQRVHDYATEFYKTYNQTHALPEKFVQAYISPPPDNNANNKAISRKKRQHNFGMALYVLYKKYPQSIDVITQDGQSGRHEPAYFELPKIDSSYSLDGEM
jgi:hypothetical protein